MRRLLPYMAFALLAAQLLLMVGSWVCSAAWPDSGVRSLLSGEGLRWFMGGFAGGVASPLLVWLLLGGMAWGMLQGSGLLSRGRSFRERRAMLVTSLLALLLLVVGLALSVVPHAVLLSATGRLWPSPFASALVPMLAFSVALLSACYGMVAGRYGGMFSLLAALQEGLHRVVPLLLFYILLAQLYHSLMFVFCLGCPSFLFALLC